MGLKEQLLEPIKIIKKPWGHEEWLSVTKKYILKSLVVKKGEILSLQYHKKKEESLHLLSGKMRLWLGIDEHNLEESTFVSGETIHVKPKVRHRVEALQDSVIIEASTTELLDVVRISDAYSREGTSKP